MNRISTSVFRFGSYCQSALISHDSISREGGSHASTRPQSQVLPSSPRSYQRPPTRGSITRPTPFPLPILWVASGPQVPIFSVNPPHATIGGTLTLKTFRRVFGSVCAAAFSVIVCSSPWRPRPQPLPETGGAFHPQ